MMKIAIDCSRLSNPKKSGTHRFLIGFLNELTKRKGYEFTFYFNNQGVNDKNFPFIKKGKVVSTSQRFFTQLVLLNELKKYDFFIFPWQTVPVLNWFVKRNVVAIIHDFGYSFKTKLTTFLAQIFSTKLFSVSTSTAKSLIRNSKVITEGVDTQIFYKIKDSELVTLRKKNSVPEKFILSIGRIEERKNIFNNLRAFSIVSKFYPNLKYCFVGSFEIKEEIIYSFIDSLKIDRDKIVFKNYVDDFTLNLYLNSSEFLIFTSQDEGFGLPVIEAYTVGKWVILSRIKQLAEFGLTAKQFVDQNNPKDIAESIIYFLNNKNNLKKEFNPNEILERNSWTRSVDLFLEGLGDGK